MEDAAQPKREVSPQDKALAADWLKKIEAALADRKEDEARFERLRKWLRGIDPDSGHRLRTNLHFANLASMRPQVYAKNPEFSIEPTKAVPPDQLEAWRAFGETAEAVLDQLLVRDGKLKKRAKRLLTSAYTTSVGWIKACWQETRERDPLIQSQIKDTQDNLARLRTQRDEMADAGSDQDLQMAKLQETLAGLEANPEIVVARGITVDFALPEDILILDRSVREIADYERATAIAHRVWMTREQYCERFGYAPQKARTYREQKPGQGVQPQQGSEDKSRDLLAVWEIWDQANGRVLTLCDGEEGFCRPPMSPDWTGERWFPFFLLAFNEIDATFLPLSDVELTVEVVREYNKARDDRERDRKNALPLNVVRRGGALTPSDVERLANRQGGDVITVEGQMGKPLSDDIWSGQLGRIDPLNYDTSPARQDMEMLVGGGDAARGSVLTAKTATEAEILAQGLRGRSSERTDIIEDMLSELGKYALEMCLRKLSPEDVKRIAGPDAQWPQLRAEEVFELVSLRVRGGSTGKPDRLQEQDRWTKLLPVVQQAMAQVAELRAAGQADAAEAVIELVRETLRRFDERVDIERFLPPPQPGEEPGIEGEQKIDPAMVEQAKQMMQELQAKVAELEKALQDKQAELEADVQKAQIAAEASVRVAEIKAPLEAKAKIAVARITAAAQPSEDDDLMEDDDAPKPPSEMQQLIDAILQSQQQMAQVVSMAMAPKPAMQVVHERDATGRIVRSVQVPQQGMMDG